MIFDLDQALAGEPVKLRNGTKAFVVCDLRKMGFKNPRLPLMVAHENSMGRGDSMLTTAEGSYTYDSTQDPRDIVGMWFEPPVSPNVGHVHQALMDQYAEAAKTNPEPWQEFQLLHANKEDWLTMKEGQGFHKFSTYRHKPKTKLIHGVRVPDISFNPKTVRQFYVANPTNHNLIYVYKWDGLLADQHFVKYGLCYPYTEEGKQAAILHAQAMLGIHPDQLDKSNDI